MPGPNRWHPDTTVTGGVMYCDASGNWHAIPVSASLGSIRYIEGTGVVVILPTSSTGVAGALWNNSGTVTVT